MEFSAAKIVAGGNQLGFEFPPRLRHAVPVAGQQTHRGAAAQDEKLFAPKQLPALRAATAEFCWLLDRDYASPSALQLVGNRHNLTSRQRMAVLRASCSIGSVEKRNELRRTPAQIRGRELWIDGYNVITVLESALGGGIVLLGRDDCCRDIAGIHRRYRKVEETVPALRFIGETAADWGVTCCRWFLDKPVSNSGRLKALILEEAAAAGWQMTVDLVYNPDRTLWESPEIIATSDGGVLDRCHGWLNLAGHIIHTRIGSARLLDLAARDILEGGYA